MDLNYNTMGKAPFISLGNKVDPDAKIKMSLDDIIEIYGPAGRRRVVRKKPLNANLTRNFKRGPGPAVRLPSSMGGYFYATKNGPLYRRNLTREVQFKARKEINRAINAQILNEKEEIIPATYKLIKTKNGVQRILVPALTATKQMPVLKVPLLRKPVQKFNKNKPPPLIDTSMDTTGSVKSFKSIKSIRSSLSSRLGPPPLTEMSQRLGPPPPLVATNINYSQPPPLVDAVKIHSLPPPLIDSIKIYSQPPPLVDSKVKLYSQCPPLIESRKFNMPPPLIDLADDGDDLDVKSNIGSLVSTRMSLSERFSNFYN